MCLVGMVALLALQTLREVKKCTLTGREPEELTSCIVDPSLLLTSGAACAKVAELSPNRNMATTCAHRLHFVQMWCF